MLIVGAEHFLRWLPKGTHEWDKFIKPEELEVMLEKSNLINIDKKGFVFNPISWDWSISNSDLSVNYVVACKRKT